MPEDDRREVRVRIGLERGIYDRFARMAEQYGVRDTWLIELACWLGLPEVESRMEGGVPAGQIRKRQLDEISGAAAAAGTSPEVAVGGGAGVAKAAEERVEYRTIGSNLPRKGPGGGSKRRKNR